MDKWDEEDLLDYFDRTLGCNIENFSDVTLEIKSEILVADRDGNIVGLGARELKKLGWETDFVKAYGKLLSMGAKMGISSFDIENYFDREFRY